MSLLIVCIALRLGIVVGLVPPPPLPVAQNSGDGYSLPQFDPNPSQRAQEVATSQAGYLYGLSLIGNSSFFPAGPLGSRKIASDVAAFEQNAAFITEAIEKESGAVIDKINQAGGFKNLSSYELLYKDAWAQSNPIGIAPGYFTNYTNDLHFSMERLSVNPFSTQRLRPNDVLPFDLDDSTTVKIAGTTLRKLQRSGRLFLASHSYQAAYKLQSGRYAAACDAYFYIHPKTGDFLPLAIKTNVGSNLTYTPLDGPSDWLLAKMMFNSNDFLQSQIFHLANSHAVAEIVYLAALRTLSVRHPVRAFLDRMMYQAYAVRVVGNQTLFNPGGFFDQTAAVDQQAVLSFVQEFYPTVAGRFRANYFRTSLVSRGLLDSSYGPQLKHFPFAEDVGPIVDSLRRFVSTFVNAYYSTSSNALKRDGEVQAWIKEANGPAKVLDFPPAPLTNRETLIDILTQIAYLTGVNHHALNSNAPSTILGLLPFHPSAFFKPLPTTKGVQDITPYLADLEHAMYQVTLQLRFQRPQLPAQGGELIDMFAQGAAFPGGKLPKEVVLASGKFREEMQAVGEKLDGKTWDQEGLCQGMPFIWRVVDPRKVPYFLSV